MPHPSGLPIVDKYSMLLEDDRVVVGASSMQGWRQTMEDAHTVFLTLPRLKNCSESDGAIFAVFDGHCGSKCAQLCSTNIVHWLCQSEAYLAGDYAKGLGDAFLKGDDALRVSLGHDESGCAAVVTLLIKDMLYCASAGDSRAILCRNGAALPLTEDHKPNLPEEKTRIERAGGFVSSGRVNGILALSRAFGDMPLKDAGLPQQLQAVTVVPSVVSVQLSSEDEFLIVACDGLFEKKNNDELVACVRRELELCDDLSMVCEKVMMECLGNGPQLKGSDNMSIIVVKLKDSVCGNGFSGFRPAIVPKLPDVSTSGDGGVSAGVPESNTGGGEDIET